MSHAMNDPFYIPDVSYQVKLNQYFMNGWKDLVQPLFSSMLRFELRKLSPQDRLVRLQYL